jgi:serine phosphatase RsbU (regulator of sigma subunit)
LLSDQTLPRGQPKRMTALLNERLHALLPRGQYATMIYLVVDPVKRTVAWCSAGGPAPVFVAPGQQIDLDGCGLPLGVKPNTVYRSHRMRLPDAGVLAVFSDGLFECGGQAPDVSRSAIAEALADAARQAATGPLAPVAQEATQRLARLREDCRCPGHSDDIVAICVAFGPRVPEAVP